MVLFAIAFGGAVGSVCRYLFGGMVQRAAHGGFPLGTLAVNVLGCLLVGVLARVFMHHESEPQLRAALIVGFCGGFTTFSTFSIETVGLLEGGELAKAAAYIGVSVLGGVLATAIGFSAMRQLNP